MSKLIEVFAIEVGSTVNDQMTMVEVSRLGYPSTETIKQIIKKYDAKYANVKKLYKLEEEK